MPPSYVLGVDFGTNTARAVVVDCADGRTLAASVFEYPSGDHGVITDPQEAHLARQHPGDYLVALRGSVRGALRAAKRGKGFAAERVVGIGADTTGSTPIPVDAACRPLALDRRWKKHPLPI